MIKIAELERRCRAERLGGSQLYLHHGVPDREAVISGHDGPPRERAYARVTDPAIGMLITDALNALPALLRLARGVEEYLRNGERASLIAAYDAFDFSE